MVVGAADAGRPLWRVVRALFPDVPEGRLQRAFREGSVRVNGEPGARKYLLKEGDQLQIEGLLTPPREPTVPERPVHLRGVRVLYHEAELLGVYKPPGIPVHGGTRLRGPSLTDWVRSRYANPESLWQPNPVHRLDKPASGLVVFGLTYRAFWAMWQLFASHDPERLRKTYFALVLGKPPSPQGKIYLPVGREGKFAVTEFRVVSAHRRVRLLELRPLEGRTHQLRRHLADMGTPILGDRRYGGAFPGIPRAMLHLYSLEFQLQKKHFWEAPLPEDFRRAMARFGLELAGE